MSHPPVVRRRAVRASARTRRPLHQSTSANHPFCRTFSQRSSAAGCGMKIARPLRETTCITWTLRESKASPLGHPVEMQGGRSTGGRVQAAPGADDRRSEGRVIRVIGCMGSTTRTGQDAYGYRRLKYRRSGWNFCSTPRTKVVGQDIRQVTNHHSRTGPHRHRSPDHIPHNPHRKDRPTARVGWPKPRFLPS